MGISLNKTTNGGKPVWCVEIRFQGRRQRRFFPLHQKSLAEHCVSDLKAKIERGGIAWLNLSARERDDLIAIAEECRDARVTLRQVWDFYRRHSDDTRPQKTLQEAIRETVAAKLAAQLAREYVEGLNDYLRLFAAGREQIQISSLKVDDLERWFRERGEAPATRASNLGRLSALFDFARRRGWILENPCERVERVRIVRKAPKILSVEQTKACLAWLQSNGPDALAYFVVGTFVGARPREMERLTWGDFHFKEKTLTIDASASKVQDRRVMLLTNTAAEWLGALSILHAASDPLAPSRATLRRRFSGLKKAVEAPWCQDILRHTAASYRLALGDAPSKLAPQLGHSVKTLMRDYMSLVTTVQSLAFWALTPKAVPPGPKTIQETNPHP